MTSRTRTAALMMGALLMAGCGAGGTPPPAAKGSLKVTSDAFAEGGAIPRANARGGGQDRSIPLEWSAGPKGTASYAIAMVDLHPMAGGFTHWLVTGVPAGTTSLAEGASGSGTPAGAVEHLNDFGSRGYGGPQPPTGSGAHRYRTTVYALDAAHLDVAAEAPLKAVEQAMRGHVLAEGSLTGTYER